MLVRQGLGVLKVDQSFVGGLGTNGEDTAIVVGVARLAQALGLARGEGVESAEQADQLTMLGCELAQGFFWSEGLAASELLSWLDEHVAGSTDASKAADASPTIRVLIVDDQPAVRDLVRLMMQLEGCFEIVAEATNGLEAIDLARELQPDLVLLDLMMPVLDGAQALPRILAVAPHAKVVVLSAVDPGSVNREVLGGASGYFDKSADLSDVIARLPRLALGVAAS